MSFDSEFKNISEWVSLGNSVSIETQYNGSCFVIANDDSNMAVALVHKGDSLHSTLRRLDKGIKSYLDSGKTIDEING